MKKPLALLLAMLLSPLVLMAKDISHTALVPGALLNTDRFNMGRPSDGHPDGQGTAYTASVDQIMQYVQSHYSSAKSSSNGDMTAAVYDPSGVHASAFARGNHTGLQSASTITGLAPVATSGAYGDLTGKPSIPAAQVASDWSAGSGVTAILHKPSLGTAAAADTGIGTTNVILGDDSRLTNSRTPTAHKSTHATGGADALTPADIGAATYAQGLLAASALQSISDSTSTTSSATAASSTAVKSAYTLAASKVSAVTGTAPVVSSGGATPAISMAAATDSVPGYMTAADHSTLSTALQPSPYNSVSGLTLASGKLLGRIASGTGAAEEIGVGTGLSLSAGTLSVSGGGTVVGVTATAPIASSGGTAPTISIPAATNSVDGYLTAADHTAFAAKGAGTVTGITGTAPVVSSGGAAPVISMAAATDSVPGYLTAADHAAFGGKQAPLISATNIKTVNGSSLLGAGDLSVNGMTYPGAGVPVSTGSAWGTPLNITGISDSTSTTSSAIAASSTAVKAAYDLAASKGAGTVTGVAGTAPVVSSGGATPAISMAAATDSVPGYLTAADHAAFNAKGAGTVTGVTGTAPVVSSGGAAPVISMAASTDSVPGYLTAADHAAFGGKQAALGYTPLNPANNLSEVTAATARSNLGLAIGTNVQAYSSNLGTYAGIAPSANAQALLGHSFSAMLTDIGAAPAAQGTLAASAVQPSAYTAATGLTLASGKMLGRTTAGSGSAEEIAIGSGLSLSGGTLSSTAGGGSVTSASIVSANGFGGSVATATSTPAITVTTSVNGIAKGNGTALSAATSGTDYAPGTSALATGIVKSTTTTGALSIAAAGTDFVAPGGALGTPSSGVATNLTGTAAGLTAGNVTTNANLTGEATSSGSNAVTLTNSAVIGKVLTGYTSGAGTVAATDTILQAVQKLNGNDALKAVAANYTNVTNDAQTRAAIVPNTAPSAGQMLLGNAGGTAYGLVPMSGDCTIASTGAITCTKTNGSAFGTSATMAGPSGAMVGTTDTQTLSAKTLTAPIITGYTETVYTPTVSAGAVTISLANGTVQKVVTAANTTITLPSAAAGTSYTILVSYGGAHSITWAGGGAIKFSGGSAPTATSVSGKYDVYTFFCHDSTNTFGVDGGRNF